MNLKRFLFIFFFANLFIFFFITGKIYYFDSPDSFDHFRRSLELSIPKTQLIENSGNTNLKGLSPSPNFIYEVNSIRSDIFEFQKENKLTNYDQKIIVGNYYQNIKELLKSKNIKDLYKEINTNKTFQPHYLMSYSGANYLPQIITLKISYFLNTNLDMAYKLMRNGNKILLFLIAGYCLINLKDYFLLTPLYCLFYLTLPTSLFLFSTVSGDAGIIGSIIFLTLLTEKKFKLNNYPISFSSKYNLLNLSEIIISVIALSAVMSKSAYIPIGLIIGSIYLFSIFKNNKGFLKYIFLILFSFTIVFSINWLIYTSNTAIEYFKNQVPFINPEFAISQVKTFSITFLKAIFNTLLIDAKILLAQAIGVFGHSTTMLLSPKILYLIIFIIGVLTFINPLIYLFRFNHYFNFTKINKNNFIKIFPSFIIVLSILISLYIMFGALWASFTVPGSNKIEAIVGRYFLPYLPLLMLSISLLLTNKMSKLISLNLLNRRLLTIGILLNLTFFYINLQNYYML